MAAEFCLTAAEGCVPLDVLAFMAAAIDLQMRRDVSPTFGGEPWTCSAIESLDGVVGALGVRKVLTFRPKLRVPGAAGFHTVVSGVEYAEALPPALGHGAIDGTTASHEVIETFGDPECDQAKSMPDGSLVDFELADPVEADAYPVQVTIGREVRVVMVSNFVTPAWFGLLGAGAGAPFDFLHKLHTPFAMTPGGYYRKVDRHGDEVYVYADDAARARVAAKLDNRTSRVARRKRA